MAEARPLPAEGPLLVVSGVSSRLTVLLGLPGQDVLVRENTGTGHSAAVLAPMIADMLTAAGIAPAELAGIACVRGPGSFTGIRVALATVLGLSMGSGAPMAGLDYLPLLAASAARHATGAVIVITHARTGQVYLQSFLADGDLAPMGPPESLFLETAAARVAEGAAVGPLTLVGDGAARYRAALLEAAPMAVIPENGDRPDPDTVLAAARKAAYGPDQVEPLYLRPCDAEENLVALTAVRGLSPETARTMFHDAVTRE